MAHPLPLDQKRFAALQIGIEGSIVQGNGGLRCQQLQHGNPVGREHARSQAILQIQCPDETRLLDDGQAKHRPQALSPHMLVRRIDTIRGGRARIRNGLELRAGALFGIPLRTLPMP